MRYLVATDGSQEGQKAVQYASTHAVAFDATLEIVHVLTPEAEIVDGEIVLPGENRAIERGEKLLEQARQLAADAVARPDDLDVETRMLTGRPANAIAEHARETDVDAIYVGHRGDSDERTQVVGSVAKAVVDKATVPVTIIR